MNKLHSNLIFWGGILILVIDLLSYYNSINVYFTTLGKILLPVSVILILIGYFLKK